MSISSDSGEFYDCEFCNCTGDLVLGGWPKCNYGLKCECPVCKGTGKYDWVTNVMKDRIWEDFTGMGE